MASKVIDSTDTMPNEEVPDKYWHTVYKISSFLSPQDEENENPTIGESDTNHNVRLSLLSGNMGAKEELLLRSHLISRMNTWKNKDQPILHESSIVSFEKDELLENRVSQLYFKPINNSKKNENIDYIICFVTSSKSGLELFQENLDVYSLELKSHLIKFMESVDVSEYLTKLEDWYENTICYVKDSLKLLDYGLATLLCAGLCGDSIQIVDHIPSKERNDIQRFIKCCSLSDLFVEEKKVGSEKNKTSLKDLVILEDTEVITVSKPKDEDFYTISPRKNSTFCEDCIKQLKLNHSLSAVEMRQMIENYKLKCIRDMNTFKRLIGQAAVDYYTCYKTYLFLVTSGNGIVLMKNARLQNHLKNDQTFSDVMDILQQFIQNTGGFGVFDTKERKELLNNKIVNL